MNRKTESNNSRHNRRKRKPSNVDESGDNLKMIFQRSALMCIAILPGMGDFKNSSSSSSSDESHYSSEYEITHDLLGRKLVKKVNQRPIKKQQ